jgi:hypothetical protein
MGGKRYKLGMRRWRRKLLINGVCYDRLCNIWASIQLRPYHILLQSQD